MPANRYQKGPRLAVTWETYQAYTQIRRQASIAEATAVFRRYIAPFGFVTFACGELDLADRDRSVYYVIDWPESWRKFYLNSKLIERDPIIDSLLFRREPFTWTDLRKDRKFGKAGREVLKYLASHGWVEGLVVPLPGAYGRMGLVSLVGTKGELDRESQAHLSLISLGFHYHVKALATRQGFARPPAGLTPRELACIRRVAKGESDARVAAGLRVAPSTAHEFIEKAKRRLKVHTRPELIAVAA